MKATDNSFELMVPTSPIHRFDAYNWAKDRGCHTWLAFGPKSNYPKGIRDTDWDNIVWSYTVYLP